MGGGPSTDINDSDYCGVYDIDISTSLAACINQYPQLANTFASLCVYDFCENYLTSSSADDIMSSGCVYAGKPVYLRTC